MRILKAIGLAIAGCVVAALAFCAGSCRAEEAKAVVVALDVTKIDPTKPNAGDVEQAVTSAVGRKIVVSIATSDAAVVKVEYVKDATEQEIATAQSTIDAFDWTKKPLTQRDIDLAVIKEYLAKDPKSRTQEDKDAALEASLRLIVG